LVPFCLLAIVVANIASLIGGERARIFAFMTALFSPVLLFFSLQILRDIYIACAVAVILHAIVVFVQSKQSVRQFISLPLLFAFSVIYLTRRPQGILMIAFAFFWVCNAKVWLLPRNCRNYVFVALNLVFVGLIYIYCEGSSEILFSIFMDNPKGEISISHLSALSDVTFTSGNEMVAALMNPKFVLVTLVAKLTNFTLGAHPFTHSEYNKNVLDLFEEFNPSSWGGYQWDDVLLVYGLQWIENWLLLVFLLAGLIGLWRYNRKVFVVMAMHWAIYAFITMFSANETRWGLPIMVIFCVIPALGYAWFGGRLNQLQPSMWMLFFVVIAVRFHGIAILMIIIPIVMFALIILRLKALDPNIICI